MQKSFTYKLAEALCWLGGALLVGIGAGALMIHQSAEGVPELLIGVLGMWYGRRWVFPKL